MVIEAKLERGCVVYGRRSMFAAIFCSLVLAALPGYAQSVPKHPHLGGFPVCEASAATLIPCPGEPGTTCLLVGDNEERQKLFAYPFDGHRLDVRKRAEIGIDHLLDARDDGELSDVEALARLSSGEILVYGSHSRNSSCERKKKRRRYLGLRFAGGEAVAGEVALERTKKGFELEKAFPDDAEGDLKRVREAVAAAERAADAAAADPGVECPPQALNVEGVVAVPGGAGDDVWIGLRAPTVDGRAVLVRQVAKLESLRFDRAALVDLGGRGIRDLTYARGWIWGLAGPVADSVGEDFVLWRFRAGELAGGGVIAVEELAAVPGSSEGLAIRGDAAIVVVDGRQLDEEEDRVVIAGVRVRDVCAVDAAYLVAAVPW